MALVRTIVNLRAIPRLKPAGRLEGSKLESLPCVSILVPARNEERIIEHTIRAFLAQDYPDFEVIVVDDRSTDATPQILASIDDPRLIVIRGEETPPGWLGKPWALHQAAARARGELLMFVDADIFYAPGTIAAAVARIGERNAAMIALLPRFELHGFWENAAMPQLAMSVFSFLPVWIGERRQIALLAVGGGPGNFVRRADYDAVGGHESLRDAVVDDVSLARRLRRSGRRTEIVGADDFVSLHMYHGLREVIEGFTKNGFAIFGRSYLFAITTVVLMIAIHFVPYVAACFGNLPAIATIVVIAATRVVLFRSLRFPLWNAILLHPVMTAIWAWIFVRSMWLTGIRRQLHWRGRTYDAAKTKFGHER
jgi:chlorobactene glucosyltransferase